MLLQRVQTLRDAFCTSIFGDFEQVEDLVYTFDEGPSTPITEDMLDSLASEEVGFDSQLVTRARLQAACFVATIGDDDAGDRRDGRRNAGETHHRLLLQPAAQLRRVVPTGIRGRGSGPDGAAVSLVLEGTGGVGMRGSVEGQFRGQVPVSVSLHLARGGETPPALLRTHARAGDGGAGAFRDGERGRAAAGGGAALHDAVRAGISVMIAYDHRSWC